MVFFINSVMRCVMKRLALPWKYRKKKEYRNPFNSKNFNSKIIFHAILTDHFPVFEMWWSWNQIIYNSIQQSYFHGSMVYIELSNTHLMNLVTPTELYHFKLTQLSISVFNCCGTCFRLQVQLCSLWWFCVYLH